MLLGINTIKVWWHEIPVSILKASCCIVIEQHCTKNHCPKQVQPLYLYQSPTPTAGRSETHVIQGDFRFISGFIPEKEFGTLFGGSLKSDAETPSGKVIGVWGMKTIKTFRRILRERGTLFSTVDSAPPKNRICVMTKAASRPKKIEANRVIYARPKRPA